MKKPWGEPFGSLELGSNGIKKLVGFLPFPPALPVSFTQGQALYTSASDVWSLWRKPSWYLFIQVFIRLFYKLLILRRRTKKGPVLFSIRCSINSWQTSGGLGSAALKDVCFIMVCKEPPLLARLPGTGAPPTCVFLLIPFPCFLPVSPPRDHGSPQWLSRPCFLKVSF